MQTLSCYDPDPVGYSRIGRGICGNEGGFRMQYCQKMGLLNVGCKKKCDVTPQCIGFNPRSHAREGNPNGWCHIFYSGEWNTDWECHNQGNAGPIVRTVDV